MGSECWSKVWTKADFVLFCILKKAGISGELLISFLTIYSEEFLKAGNAELEPISPIPLPVFMFCSVLEDLKPEGSGPKVCQCFGMILDLSDSYSPLSSKSRNVRHHLLASSTASADTVGVVLLSLTLSALVEGYFRRFPRFRGTWLISSARWEGSTTTTMCVSHAY